MLSEWKIEPGTKRRIRLANLSAMADGGSISEAAQWPETTVLVPVGSIRTVEFIANNPADWAIHCHMTHHVMSQMGHRLPNIVGIEPGKLDKQVRASCPAT